MTRTQAWRTLAEAYSTPPERRTRFQEKVTRNGLCHGLSTLGVPDAYRMLRALGDEMGVWGYWWPLRCPQGDGCRALFAGLMAAMTQKERDRLQRGL
jgi:hypothetical protein